VRPPGKPLLSHFASSPFPHLRVLAGGRYYDVELGRGALADVGERVVVHYDARWRGVTFMTSSMGQSASTVWPCNQTCRGS